MTAHDRPLARCLTGTFRRRVLNSDGLAASEGRRLYEDLAGEFLNVPVIVEAADAAFSSVRALIWRHATLHLLTLICGPASLDLTMIAGGKAGTLMVRAMDGSLAAESPTARLAAERGGILILPAGERTRYRLSAGGRIDIAFLPDGTAPQAQLLRGLHHRSFSPSCLPLQLLIGYAGYLLQRDCETEAEADLLVSHFHTLLPLLAATVHRPSEADRGASRLQAIRRTIEERMTESQLSVETIAALHGVTARTVQKLFQQEGTTFSRHLRERRLDAARQRIALGDPTQPINRIAYDVGFSDLSYFNRSFMARYGQRPSDMRGRR
ncbi:transcriptional regulator, AraC family [Rhizobium sp. RU20A]|uniref:helix-turn-helix transcriptional regulator n=1 Tax=Rhizobium sp. RU20A TaxID=1907412 RepID=UPI000954FA21|nr:helix-turn-helix transcriptional regulator [Rhizobium sp. RU20A]SIQ72124.1 transcriptional regulator, AraC family [Rhizobium sp. RU20A]